MQKCIAIDCRMATASGIGTYIRNVVPLCIMALPDVNFLIITSSKAENSQNLYEFDNVRLVKCDAPVYSIKEQYAIAKIISGCDGVWIPHYNIPLCSCVPLMVTVHDVAHLALPDVFSLLQRCYARILFSAVQYKARQLIFNSYVTQSEFIKYVGSPHGATLVTHLGVSADWFAPEVSPSPYPWPYIVAVGNLKPHKNLQMLAEAFARIACKVPHHLLFVGTKSGLRTSISSNILENFYPERIHCLGSLPFMQLKSIIHHAQWLVFPSMYEGFGFPPLEAMACGVRVLASDIPVIREICGRSVCYVTGNSVENWAMSLLQALRGALDTQLDISQNITYALSFAWQKTAAATVQALRDTFINGSCLAERRQAQ